MIAVVEKEMPHMFDALLELAREPTFLWSVLAVAAAATVVEAVRASRKALWGDLFSEDFD